MNAEDRSEEVSITDGSRGRRRPLIGVLSAEVRGWYGNYFLSGVAAEAEEAGVDVLWFIGGRLEDAESGASWLFDLARRAPLDGLIIVGDLTLGSDSESIRKFCESFAPRPVVCGVDTGSVSVVLPDSNRGMYILVSHLIESHGHSSIAFISGPSDQSESRERYLAYHMALKTHQLDVDARLVVPGDYSEGGGRRAVRQLLDEVKLPFTALVAANDSMALGALEELESRGVRVPKDVALAGFDDVEAARLAAVPLTTVRQPFFDSGRTTASLLFRLIRKDCGVEKVRVPTEVVLRASCGCLSPAVEGVTAHRFTDEERNGRESAPEITVERITRELVRVAEFSPWPAGESERRDQAQLLTEETATELARSFLDELWGSVRYGFLSRFRLIIQPSLSTSAETGIWHNVLSALRGQVLAMLKDKEKVVRAEDLLHEARVVLAESIPAILSRRRVTRDKVEAALQSFDYAIGAVVDLHELPRAVAEELPGLGIDSCHLVLYDGAGQLENLETFPERSTLVVALQGGVIRAEEQGSSFPALQFLPGHLLTSPDVPLRLVEPLSFGGKPLGYMVLGVEHSKWEVYAQLRSLLSSALHRILLTEERQRARREVERLLEEARLRATELAEAKDMAEGASRAKSEFLANMSHELRTPLNGILGYAQILGGDSGLSPHQLEGVQIIRDCGEHLLTLINDILDLSKIEARRLELLMSPFPLEEFLWSLCGVIRMRAEQKGLRFEFVAEPALPGTVCLDENRLRQVLMNLLSNAVKFTDKGAVWLRVSACPEAESSRVVLRFEVEDTGPGIAEAELGRVFEPFEQAGDRLRRFEGTGLGLAISRRLVRAMGGDLLVTSRIGAGSLFFFEISAEASDVETESAAPQAEITGYEGPRKRVLVVDDEPSNRLLLERILEPLGFVVEEAANGQEAVEKIRNGIPDMVLMDIVMPVMSGFEATEAVRRLPGAARLPIVATSASVFDEHQARSRAAGCDDFLPKPIDSARLLELARRHMGIVWIHEEKPGPSPEAAPEAPKAVVPPPASDLRRLYDLAMRGEMRTLQEEAARLEKEHAESSVFCREMRELARDFDDARILAILSPLVGDAA